MKIISFDVGLKNLAYCIIDYSLPETDTSSSINVIDWNIIDITNEKKLNCSTIMKNAKICNAKATHYCQTESGDVACCKKKRCQELFNLKYKEDKFTIHQITSEKISDISIIEITERIIKELNQRKDILLNIDRVIIENQPAYTPFSANKFKTKSIVNPLMKSVQMIITTFYIMNGITDIHLFFAKNKHNIYDGPIIESSAITDYAKRKELSIHYCKYFLKKHNQIKWLTFYAKLEENNIKIDDLADSFLQCLTYLFNVETQYIKQNKKQQRICKSRKIKKDLIN